MPRNTSSRLPLDQRQRNRTSIWDVPADAMPDGAGQLVLIAIALCGRDVYAYQSGGSPGE
jgi:hypothetical protein